VASSAAVPQQARTSLLRRPGGAAGRRAVLVLAVIVYGLTLLAMFYRTWKRNRKRQVKVADNLRMRLHGHVCSASERPCWPGVLALVVLGIGAFAQPAKVPTSVVVIQGGQVTCGSISVGADGTARVGGREISQATQVVVVAHC
jgi:hypothetical protein